MHTKFLGICLAVTMLITLLIRLPTSHRRSLPPPVTPHPPGLQEAIEIDEAFHFEAEDVLAGQPLRHVFRYHNPGVDELTLRDTDGIRTSCGCTDVQVSPERLPPGESTDVTLAIDTSSRLGDVSESATLSWCSADGNLRHCQFTLSGTIESAFVFEPGELNFTRDDVREAKTKTVRVSSDLPIDWRRTRIHADEAYVEVTCQNLDDSSGELLLTVRCLPTHEGETRRAGIHLFAEPSAACSSDEASLIEAEYHSVISVYSSDIAEIRIAPRIPTFNPNQQGTQWQGYVILTGDYIESGAKIRQVTAKDCHVHFHTIPLGAAAQRIDLTIDGPPANLGPTRRELKLVFADGQMKSTWVQLASDQFESFDPSLRNSNNGALEP